MIGFIIGLLVGIPLGFLITGWFMFLKMKESLNKPIDIDGIMKKAINLNSKKGAINYDRKNKRND